MGHLMQKSVLVLVCIISIAGVRPDGSSFVNNFVSSRSSSGDGSSFQSSFASSPGRSGAGENFSWNGYQGGIQDGSQQTSAMGSQGFYQGTFSGGDGSAGGTGSLPVGTIITTNGPCPQVNMPGTLAYYQAHGNNGGVDGEGSGGSSDATGSSSDSSGLSDGDIAGITLGTIAGAAAVGGALWKGKSAARALKKRFKKKKGKQSPAAESAFLDIASPLHHSALHGDRPTPPPARRDGGHGFPGEDVNPSADAKMHLGPGGYPLAPSRVVGQEGGGYDMPPRVEVVHLPPPPGYEVAPTGVDVKIPRTEDAGCGVETPRGEVVAKKRSLKKISKKVSSMRSFSSASLSPRSTRRHS